MFVSVIIPTFNRKRSLQGVLQSLAAQTYPRSCFEVIVVDDGSTDDTHLVACDKYPFSLRYLRQSNQGDAIARNTGAREATADLLVFLDDDITVVPDFVMEMAKSHEQHSRRIVIGVVVPVDVDRRCVLEEPPKLDRMESATLEDERADFTDCLSGFFSIRRSNYIGLGMMQPVTTSGSSVFCDIEFAFRAHKKGFSFWRNTKAIGYHRDSAMKDLPTFCRRAFRVGQNAPLLFQKHPEIATFLPMFRDKTPISWQRDSPRLIVRKLARHVASSVAFSRSMELAVGVLEQLRPTTYLLRPLYRWIIGAYTFRGYRQGLREFKNT